MHRKISHRKVAALIGIPASLVLTRAIWAQTSTWTGASTGAPDNLWTDPTNWDIGAVPVSGSTAAFTNIGNGNTNISLGGANQPIGSITFSGSANSYNLGTSAGDALTFDSGGSITTSSSGTNAQVISGAIDTTGNLTITNGISNGATSGAGLTGLTVNAIKITGGGLLSVSDFGATETTSLNGPITDVAGQPGSVSILANTSPVNNTIIINGFNTYSGTTALMVTAQGTIQFSTDSPFGTGAISVFNTGQMQAVGGSHTISNAITFNSGMNFTGTNTITLAGTLAINNTAVNGSRTFASNGTMTVNWGNANSPSIFNLGNPISNGGQGAGNYASFTYSQPGTYIINDLMQNPGTGSGGVICTFSTGGTYAVNSLNTYTGTNTFGGTGSGGLVTFNHSYIAGGTSGPFGLGQITFSASNGVALQPTGGNQTLANPVTMTQGFSVSNASADNSGLTLAGNITMSTTSRFLTNNFPSAVLTLGVATSPATLTLGNNLQLNGGGTTVINDLIQNNGANAGGILVTSGLTQLTDSSNTYSKGSTVNGGTLSVSADGDLGSSSASISLGGGTLLSTGTFTSARSVNLTGTVAGTVDATGGNTLTLTGTFGGSGDLTKGTNAGTLQLANPSGYTFSGNVNALGGTLAFGTNGGSIGPVNVPGALNVSDGAVAQFLPSTTAHVLNTVNTLNLNNTGLIDLSNSDLSVNNSLSQVRSYLAQAYAGGAWTGTSGITSSVVEANPSTLSIAYVSGANTNNAALNPALTNTSAVLLRPSLIGDFNLDGKVDRFDIRQFNARNAFNDGLTTHDWADGDLNGDGKVDRFDIRILNASNNFNSGNTFVAQAQTLSSSVSPATGNSINNPTTVGTVGDGKPDLIYNPSTGDVVFSYDGYNPGTGKELVEIDVQSSKSDLNPSGANTSAAQFVSKASNDVDYQDVGTGIADGVDLGTIMPVGSTPAALTNGDIVVNLYLNGEGTSNKYADITSTPEPTTLSLMGLAAAGLLGRRRKKTVPR